MSAQPAADGLFRAVFAANPDALLLVDRAGTIVLANPQAHALLGYAEGELAGRPVEVLVPDAIRPRHASYRSAYAQHPQPRPMGTQTELVARRRDGSSVMVEIALSPLQDQGLPYVVAAIRGVGEYPRVQQALRRARHSEQLALMGQLAADSRDPQALLRAMPAAAAQALQLEAAAIYLLASDRASFRVAGAVGLDADEAASAPLRNRPDTAPGFLLAHGSLPPAWRARGWAAALAVPVSDRGQTVGVLAVRSRRAQRFGDDEQRCLQSMASLLATSLQRAHSEEALQHAQRLESVGQLTGGIAHDFNNLLTVIQGNLQVLDEHPAVADDPPARQMIASAARASRRGADLTAKLLAFSRRQVLSPSRVDVAALLESLADMLRRTLDQRVRIEVDTARALPCRADAGQLEAALLNLAINARDAMPDGGTLAFACRPCADLPAEVAAELDGPGDRHAAYVAIDVTDTGCGMSDAVRARAFEPFFTTKDLGRGTGLGLATVYGFVKQSSGAVQLRSAPGAGTTVTLLLPGLREAAAQASDAATPLRPLPAGLQVLLVEDEAEVRAVVRQQLHDLGCSVTEFGSAEQALASLAADAPHDLLLSDVMLGAGLRGPDLARALRERLPRLRVLLMSGYSSDPDVPGVLRKPFERQQLQQAIARALA